MFKHNLFLASQDILTFFLLTGLFVSAASAQQIDISTIDTMPNFPSPYHMRNWKKVALGYDSLVFNENAAGRYLPLVWSNNNSVNYPGQPHFGLYTVVGPTANTGTAEAINSIPAVVGATLVGINKSNQFGMNWAQMCQDWFNKSNGQNIYKNGFDDQTYDDFWYETMPNVFFYELNYLYPHLGSFDSQFVSVADQFSKAVTAMGGSTTPWTLPNINHQGFDFSTMKPFDATWKEPEAAGAIAWILYNAYVVTGNPKYRVGAELSMEFLKSFPANPAYELQLSYGAYIAARMNAELGTNYDVQKIVNWLFSESDVRPPWGTVTGNWGGYDADGLVGEVDQNNYAFAMNTFEQVGTLVPMVRYDPRFATAIGKWVLNAANAARLFYPKFLPAANQDSSYGWAMQYDPNSYIAHEAIHQSDPANGNILPYASGDAITGGWGLTTLALYGSSHVGILGAIIDTTNVTGILKLNLLATDYYHAPAYPSYLYYNPDSVAQAVRLDVGIGTHDVYDAVSKKFIAHGVSGITSIPIPANSAIVAVITPSSGIITYNYDQMLVNGVVVDYHYSQSANYPPRIKSLTAARSTVVFGDTIKIYCTATDIDGDMLSYAWHAPNGSIFGMGAVVNWIAPDTTGTYAVSCAVNDGHGLQDTASIVINVVEKINLAPSIYSIVGNPRVVNVGGNLQLTCHAADPDGDTLSYSWNSSAGSLNGTDSVVAWMAPATEGYYYVHCTVKDGFGGTATDSIGILVQDFSKVQTGNLVAYYPLDNGSANDASGNNNNGFNFYTKSDTDRFGNPNGALFFDGTTSYVEVANSSMLNFQNAITVSFWMKIKQIFAREEYALSHNKWNRWKVSISNGHLRWSIGTTTGVHDLDSGAWMVADSLYFVTVVYTGAAMEIFLNGNLDAYAPWSGKINTANVDLMIGAVYPGDNTASFYGGLDDIRIYNYAISFPDIQNLLTDVVKRSGSSIPTSFVLHQNFPNPFNPSTQIEYDLPMASRVTLVVYDILGRRVRTLVDGMQEAGRYSVNFVADNLASGVYFYRLKADNYTKTKAMMILK